MKEKKRGFTLVELLITIVIIAVLAGMMLLSTGAAISTAEASKIVSDLKTLQAAVLFYYLTNDGLPSVSQSGSPSPLSTTEVSDLSKYVDRDLNSSRYSEVYLVKGPSMDDGRILIGLNYKSNAGSMSAKLPNINQRLKQMAFTAGLFNADGTLFEPTGTTESVFIWLK